jgi:hypothetical protein
MSVSIGQVIVPAGGTALCPLPPGPASVTVSNAGTATIYLGAGTASPSVLSGMPVPSGGIFTFQLYPGGGGSTLRAVASAGGSSTCGFVVSQSSGLGPNPGIY